MFFLKIFFVSWPLGHVVKPVDLLPEQFFEIYKIPGITKETNILKYNFQTIFNCGILRHILL